jgi:hypothetical protein
MVVTRFPRKLRQKPPVVPTPGGGGMKKRMFSYTLGESATTSAGIYDTSGKVLLRTLWSNEVRAAGTHLAFWDGRDDLGKVLPEGSYQWKVLHNNVKYEWQGVINNNSRDLTGHLKWVPAQNISGMVAVEDECYLALAYAEGHGDCWQKFNVNNPWVRIPIGKHAEHSAGFVCSDGARIYFGGPHLPFNLCSMVAAVDRTKDDADHAFVGAPYLNNQFYAIAMEAGFYDPTKFITGMAVQQNGRYLFVSYKNHVLVLDKITGEELRTWALADVRHLCLLDDNRLWLIHGQNTVEIFALDELGVGTATGIVAAGPIDPVRLAIRPSDQALTVQDGTRTNDWRTTATHQLWDFNSSTGEQISEKFGDTTGYTLDPNVNDYKWFFCNTKAFEETDSGQSQPYIAYQSDGMLWVGDIGNRRNMRYDTNRQYHSQLRWTGYNYSCTPLFGEHESVFVDYLEYGVTYPDLSDRLLRNYSAGYLGILDYDAFLVDSALRDAEVADKAWTSEEEQAFQDKHTTGYDNPYLRLNSATAFRGSRRRYALTTRRKFNEADKVLRLVELPKDSGMRLTGVAFPHFNYKIDADGTLRGMNFGVIGEPAFWTRQELVSDPAEPGTDPAWGPAKRRATSQPLTLLDAVSADGYLLPNQETSTGIMATFSRDVWQKDGDRGAGFHLAGVPTNDTNSSAETPWAFRTSQSTFREYEGNYPENGQWDGGNGVVNVGKFMQALERSIFWGAFLEFWKNAQGNKWNHYFDNGLMVGQFGVVNRSDYRQGEAPAMLSSNGGTGGFVKVGEDYYLYHCDEGFHAGTHRWKISGLNTIQELSGLVVLGTAPAATSVDLHAELRPRTRLVSGTAGWTCFPANDVAGEKYPQWKAGTGYYQTDGLDMSARLRPSGANPLRDAWLARALPTPAQEGPWEVRAKAVRFLIGSQDQDADYGKVQVRDRAGKIITEFSRRYAGDYLDLIYSRKKVGTDTAREWVPRMFNYPELRIGVDLQKRLYVDYAGFPREYLEGTTEDGADQTKPAEIRAVFHTQGTREYGVDFVELEFFPLPTT